VEVPFLAAFFRTSSAELYLRKRKMTTWSLAVMPLPGCIRMRFT